eukprot:11210222-Lingulodinium_polyedra.AAC.1
MAAEPPARPWAPPPALRLQCLVLQRPRCRLSRHTLGDCLRRSGCTAAVCGKLPVSYNAVVAA